MTRSIPGRFTVAGSASASTAYNESTADMGASRKQGNQLNETQSQLLIARNQCVGSNVPSHQQLTNLQQKQERDANTPSIIKPEAYTQPFLSFISNNPTVFHAVSHVGKRLEDKGFTKLSEREAWNVVKGGKYYFERNGSSLIAFVVGKGYQAGNGASIIASHIDALTTRLKPISTLSSKAGYVQLGVAPYAGALNGTWWDRDLGVGGRVLIKNGETGKIETRLVKLDWPIARIPTLAPHFGQAAHMDGANKETEMVSHFSAIFSFTSLDINGLDSASEAAPSKIVLLPLICVAVRQGTGFTRATTDLKTGTHHRFGQSRDF